MSAFLVGMSTYASAGIWAFDVKEMILNKDSPVYLKSLAKGDGCVESKEFDNAVVFKKAAERKYSAYRWSLDTSGEIPSVIAYKGKNKTPVFLFSVASSEEDCRVASAMFALQAGITPEIMKKYK
jgi:hypothetical protein